MVLWLWIAFFLLIALMVAIDLGAFGRRGVRVLRPVDGLASTALWILAAVAVAILLQKAYLYNVLGLGVGHDDKPHGHVWEQFLNAYITEVALSIDNIAVFAMLFQRFNVRPAVRNRILFWSIITSLVLRALLINGGLAILHLAWAPWAFAGILFLAGFRTLTLPDDQQAFEKRWLTRLAEKFPLWEMLDPRDSRAPGGSERHAGGRRVSILMVIAVCVAADLSLAIDSVPAVLAVTRDPTIAIAGVTFAILALRALYVAISDALTRLRYWKIALTIILFGLSVLHVTRRDGGLPVHPHTVTLSLLGVTAAGLGLSALRSRRARQERPTPLRDMADAVETSRRNVKKVIILIVGTVIILFGILIAPLPGPGPIVLVPIGLAILATEFIWARTLLNQLKDRTQQLQASADRLARKTSPWLVPPVVLAYWSAMWAIWHFALDENPRKLLFFAPVAIFSFVPIAYWALRVFRARRESPPATSIPSAHVEDKRPPSAAA